MKKVSLNLFAIVMTAMMLSSCGGSSSNEQNNAASSVEGGDEVLSIEIPEEASPIEVIDEVLINEVTDEVSFSEVTDEVSFSEVTIGVQVWMSENLNVDKFRNGEPIPEAKTREDWNRAGENGEPVWCYYNYDPANGEEYGKLYNWYAVNDARGLAPKGWNIPSDDDWGRLLDYLGGKKSNSYWGVGTKMKSTYNWIQNHKGESGNGTNESRFSGLPGGSSDGTGMGKIGFWWSSTEVDATDARYISLDNVMGLVGWHDTRKKHGFSVRCLRVNFSNMN
jgi:uncharacterized protein (TIGR02145 family)